MKQDIFLNNKPCLFALQLRKNNEGAILEILTFYNCIRIKCDHKNQLSRIIDVVILNFKRIVIITRRVTPEIP